MLNQGPSKGQWFSSLEYKLWFTGMLPTLLGVSIVDSINLPGSFISVLGLPLTTLAARNDIVTVRTSIRGGAELTHFRTVRRLDRFGRLIRVARYDHRIYLCSHQVPWFPSSYQVRGSRSRHCRPASYLLPLEREPVLPATNFVTERPAQIARFIFRMMFCLPLFIIGLDAVGTANQIINHHP